MVLVNVAIYTHIPRLINCLLLTLYDKLGRSLIRTCFESLFTPPHYKLATRILSPLVIASIRVSVQLLRLTTEQCAVRPCTHSSLTKPIGQLIVSRCEATEKRDARDAPTSVTTLNASSLPPHRTWPMAAPIHVTFDGSVRCVTGARLVSSRRKCVCVCIGMHMQAIGSAHTHTPNVFAHVSLGNGHEFIDDSICVSQSAADTARALYVDERTLQVGYRAH